MRKQWNQLLKRKRDAMCPRTACVYNERGRCDEPFTNYGNSDADCHGMTYKQVVVMLETEHDHDYSIT